MRPVVELRGRIIQVREAKKGESIGYGATFTTTRPTKLAIIAVGYGDGYARAASANKSKPAADVIIARRRCPLLGRVSMDLIAADVSDIPEGIVKRGDYATLLGIDIGVDELAAAMGTIGYEVLTSLGRRYRRIYKNP
jgi:alanine racemase